MDTFVEAGVTPMQTIQGATKWSAEMIDKQNELGTVEVGKLANVIVVNRDLLLQLIAKQ
jgi:imidazolonepropionase-like amidohydrolase